MTEKQELTAHQERRLKIVRIHQRFAAELLNIFRAPPAVIHVPTMDFLPDDALAIGTNYSYSCQCIEVLVASKSFPVVEPGQAIPLYPGLETEFQPLVIPKPSKEPP